MKRLPLMIAFVLFIALCVSAAYWAMEFMAPAPRAVATPPQAKQQMPPIAAAGNLFGGESAQGNTIANIQLRGVIHAGRASESVAIIATENGPPKYLREDAEVTSGVKIKEIHPKYVVLSDHGVERQVSLPAFTTAQAAGNANLPPVPATNAAPPAGVNTGATASGNGGGTQVQAGRQNIPQNSQQNSQQTAPQGAPLPARQ